MIRDWFSKSIGRAFDMLGYKIERAESSSMARQGFPHDFENSDIETIRVVAPYTMTSPERIVSLCQAVRYLLSAGIKGDIVECGVWRGGSMMAVARTLLGAGVTSRPLHLFDTFEGMTPPTEKDVTFSGRSAADALETSPRDANIWARAPLRAVQGALRSTGYDMSAVRFVKGPVEETLPRHAPDSIGLLRLDTDWYVSTRHELIHLFPRLSRGGVLIIDDYGHWKGARRATDEYLEENRVRLLLNRIDYAGRIAVKLDD